MKQEKKQRNDQFLSGKKNQINEFVVQSKLLDSVEKVNEMNGQIETAKRELELFEKEIFNFVPIIEQTGMNASINKIGRINEGSQITTISNQERTTIHRGPNLEKDLKK